MDKLDELIDNYYEKFVDLPNGKPIVRRNQKNDMKIFIQIRSSRIN